MAMLVGFPMVECYNHRQQLYFDVYHVLFRFLKCTHQDNLYIAAADNRPEGAIFEPSTKERTCTVPTCGQC